MKNNLLKHVLSAGNNLIELEHLKEMERDAQQNAVLAYGKDVLEEYHAYRVTLLDLSIWDTAYLTAEKLSTEGLEAFLDDHVLFTSEQREKLLNCDDMNIVTVVIESMRQEATLQLHAMERLHYGIHEAYLAYEIKRTIRGYEETAHLLSFAA